MSNLLQQLENNEAILLMYLAGELPQADRAEVEQMLASDAALRAELAEMASLQDDVAGVLSLADAAGHAAPARVDAAARRVGRAVAAAVAARGEAPAVKIVAGSTVVQPHARLRIRWWAYPVAAAAMLAIGMMLFNGKHPRQVTPSPDQQVAQVLPDILAPVDREDSLSAIEQEAYSIRDRENGPHIFGGDLSE